MAVLFFDGFEKYGTSGTATLAGLTTSTSNFNQASQATVWLPFQGFVQEWFTYSSGNNGGSPAMGLITGRSGGSTIALGMHCDGNNALIFYRNLGSNPARIIVGFAFMCSLVGTPGLNFDDGQVGTQCSVWIDGTGHVNFSRSAVGGANVLFTSAATVLANTWHYLEIDLTIDVSAGSFTIWLDNIQLTSLSSQNTRAQTNSFVNRLAFSTSNTNGCNLGIDDVYCFDTTGTTNKARIGNSVVDTLLVANDSAVQFTPSMVLGYTYTNSGQNFTTTTNTVYLVPVTPIANCTLNSISFCAQSFSSTSNFKAALVSSTGGVPTQVIAIGTNVGGATAIPNTQVFENLTLPFGSGQSLVAGTQYFIGFFTDTAINIQISDRFQNIGQRAVYQFADTSLTPQFETLIGNFTYTNSNLTATRQAINANIQRLTHYVESGTRKSGLLYFEVLVATWSNNSWGAGLSTISVNTTVGLGSDANGFGAYFSTAGNNGFFWTNNTFFNNQWTSAAPVGGNTVCFAVDFTHGKIWVRLNNGGWNASAGGTQDPATNQGGFNIATLLAQGVVPAFGDGFSGAIQAAATFNTAGSFTFSPPSGFSAWDSGTPVLSQITTGLATAMVWGNCSAANNYPTFSATNIPSVKNLPVIGGQTLGYVSSSTVNQEDLYTTTGMTFDPQSIACVKVSVAAQKAVGGARTFDIRLKSGTTESGGSNPGISPGTSAMYYNTYYPTDPDTTFPWGTSKVNASKIGFKIIT